MTIHHNISHKLHSMFYWPLSDLIPALVSAFSELECKVTSTWSNLVPWEHNVTSPTRPPSSEESTLDLIRIHTVRLGPLGAQCCLEQNTCYFNTQKYTSPRRKAWERLSKLPIKICISWIAFLVHIVSVGQTGSHGSIMFPQAVHLLCAHQYRKCTTPSLHLFMDQTGILGAYVNGKIYVFFFLSLNNLWTNLLWNFLDWKGQWTNWKTMNKFKTPISCICLSWWIL